MSQAQATITLPPSLVGTSDAARLIRELEALDATMVAQQVRGLAIDASRVSQAMADVAEVNTLDLTEADQRTKLKKQLKLLKGKAPIIHVVFAEQPEPEFMAQVVAWSRDKLHPRALLRVGMQPSIVAGCIVRTPSHIYDFSIGSVLKGKRDILTQLIKDRLSGAGAGAADGGMASFSPSGPIPDMSVDAATLTFPAVATAPSPSETTSAIPEAPAADSPEAVMAAEAEAAAPHLHAPSSEAKV